MCVLICWDRLHHEMHVSFCTRNNNIHPDTHGLRGRSHHVVHPIVGLHTEGQRGVGALGRGSECNFEGKSEIMENNGERGEVTHVWEGERTNGGREAEDKQMSTVFKENSACVDDATVLKITDTYTHAHELTYLVCVL